MQGAAVFGETTPNGKTVGLVKGDVQAKSGDGFGRGEAIQVDHQGQEEGGYARADARDLVQDAPGLRAALGHGVDQRLQH